MRARVHTVWRCASRWGGEGSQEGADAPATRLCAGWQDAENTKSLSRRRALRSAIEPDLRENTLVKQRFCLSQACHECGIHSTAEWCAAFFASEKTKNAPIFDALMVATSIYYLYSSWCATNGELALTRGVQPLALARGGATRDSWHSLLRAPPL